MRIVLFNFSSSGLFHYSASLVLQLAEQGSVEKILFITSHANNTSLLIPHPKLQVIALPFQHTSLSLVAWLLNPTEQLRLRRKIREFQPDIVHITDVIPVYALYYFLLSRFPKVITIHDPTPHAGDRGQFSTRLMLRYFAAIGDRFIVHGKILKKELATRQHIRPEKITVIPIGAWPALAPVTSTNASLTANSVLFFGRIVAYKGLGVLLDAIYALQQNGKSVWLIVAGSGDMAPYQAQLRRLPTAVIVNRYISEQEAQQYFQEAALVVLPYKEATQSAVATIAMAAGKPIIATRVGALPELLEHNKTALLVEPSASALAEAIERVLGDITLQKKLGDAALHAAQTKFSWATVAAQHVRLYQELCQ